MTTPLLDPDREFSLQWSGTRADRPDETWLYLKLYPAELELLDQVVIDVVTPWMGHHLSEVSGWFFLRFLDARGPHIRLRLRTGWQEADRLAADCDRLAEQLAALGDGPGRRNRPLERFRGSSGLPARCVPAVLLDLYEPELAKWGGAEYLSVAESVFETSSGCALRMVPLLDGAAQGRIALGVVILTELLQALDLSHRERVNFLATHYQWWSGGPGHAGGRDDDRDPLLRETARQLSADVGSGKDIIAAAGDLGGLINEFVCAVLASLPLSNPDQKPLFLVFHQLHLMLNRLGIAPNEEAVVSLITRDRVAGP